MFVCTKTLEYLTLAFRLSPAEVSLALQVKRVIDPEAEALRLAEMRRLQRQMKGVKLQYIAENDTVFFDDVAGIGEAKVTVLPYYPC